MKRCTRLALLLCLWAPAAALAACQDPEVVDDDDDGDDDDDDSTVTADGLGIGPELGCAEPAGGIARLTEEGVARGLTEVVPGPPEEGPGAPGSGRGGAVVVSDLDGDGDPDLLVGRLTQPPVVYVNDGEGQFEAVLDAFAAWPGASESPLGAFAAADLDGDGLPEIVGVGVGFLVMWPNRGGHAFGAPVTELGLGRGDNNELLIFQSLSLGDIDGDGDLDAALAGLGLDDGGGGAPIDGPGLDWLVRWQDGQFEPWMQLRAGGGAGSRSMSALFTDRDGDGDMDLYIPGDLGPPSAFWRNDGIAGGVPLLVDDAETIGADTNISAMGIDSADLDGDGELDLCLSDRAPPLCLLTGFGDGYVAAGPALGLVLADPPPHPQTIGWSIDFADIDHDGFLDAMQSSGPDRYAWLNGQLGMPDLFWRGQPDGTFADATEEVDFGDNGASYGLATADLDGDGWLEVVVVGPGQPPLLWSNRCGVGAWTEIDLIGPPGNTEGLGAKVVVVDDTGRSRIRELSGLRGQGQGPSVAHFGLGEAVTQIEQLDVRWPGGLVTSFEDAPVRRKLVVRHPDAEL